MNELQQLEAKIRQALPKLMEDVFITTPYGEKVKIREEFRGIYLSDVLSYLICIEYGMGSLKFHQVISKFELSNPLLKDQPKEVIEYLNQLK